MRSPDDDDDDDDGHSDSGDKESPNIHTSSSSSSSSTPWVEKYRPQSIEHIIMDKYNRRFFESIIQTDHCPHLLFYGPPGTGKTTSIFSLIRQFMPHLKKEILHLNASDDRGIDVIRSQILQFVHSNTFYRDAKKFVILDEVDNMTKNAQHGLTYLLQSVSLHNVRFCLICNYISKIVPSLKHEFIIVRFNQLPQKEIIQFLSQIADKEQLFLSKSSMKRLCGRFSSDVRSMINYMQTQSTSAAGAGAGAAANTTSTSTSTNKKLAAAHSIEDAVEGLDNIDDLAVFIDQIRCIQRDYRCNLKTILRELFMKQLSRPTETASSSCAAAAAAADDKSLVSMMEMVMHNIHGNMDEVNLNYVFLELQRQRQRVV
jgi:DNA polymerase III delta prime subunit